MLWCLGGLCCGVGGVVCVLELLAWWLLVSCGWVMRSVCAKVVCGFVWFAGLVVCLIVLLYSCF